MSTGARHHQFVLVVFGFRGNQVAPDGKPISPAANTANVIVPCCRTFRGSTDNDGAVANAGRACSPAQR